MQPYADREPWHDGPGLALCPLLSVSFLCSAVTAILTSKMEAVEGQAADGPLESPTALVHVVSPSSEVPDKLTFPNLSLATTIGEMKLKIQDAVVTKPAPQRQRLIYRGRALIQQDLTLATLFGNEAV